MIRPIILSPDAEADIDSVVRWYHRGEPNLSVRFTEEKRTLLDRIAKNPYRFPLIKGVVRRALFIRFPYAIFFTLNDDVVFVIAVLHQRRASSAWKKHGNGQT